MVQPELRIIIAIIVLLYASALDLRHRRINDLAWKVLVASGAVLTIGDTFANKAALVDFVISITVMAAILLPLERLKKIGGGDVKIILGLASLIPTNPYHSVSVFPIFSLSVFTNAIFLTAAVPFYFLVLNLYRRDLDAGNTSELRFLLLGYKKRSVEVSEHEKIMKRIGNDAWVTPALPFVVPLTLGFLLSLLWGDVSSYLVLALRKS